MNKLPLIAVFCAIILCASPSLARLADLDGRMPPPAAPSYDQEEPPVTAVYGYFLCNIHFTACRMIGHSFRSTDAACVASLDGFKNHRELFACGKLRVHSWEPVQ